MKPFWIFCLAVLGYGGILASCGPKHRYCPNEMDMECHVYDDGGGMMGAGGTNFNPCPDGGSQIFEDGAFVCK